MHLNNKQWAIVAILLSLVGANIAIAAWVVTRTLDITGGVAVQGNIQLYDEIGSQIITGFNFDEFTVSGTQNLLFQIRNTGNTPAVVTWDLTDTSIVWNLNTNYFTHDHDTQNQFTLRMNKRSPLEGIWAPAPSSLPAADKQITLQPGEAAPVAVQLDYSGTPNTPETFSLKMSFTAQG